MTSFFSTRVGPNFGANVICAIACRSPGRAGETAEWLADQEIVALGTDTMAVDVDPPEDPAYPRVVHQVMLIERGVHLIENLHLDELVTDKTYEFLFMLATLKLNGGTAFPVEPIAIV